MAEYTGSIELISGIKPKNNGDFPLVEAKDVLMPDGKRLDKWTGGGSTGGDTEVVNANLGTDGMTVDKSFTELKDAFLSGKVVTLTSVDENGSTRCYYCAKHYPFNPPQSVNEMLLFGCVSEDTVESAWVIEAADIAFCTGTSTIKLGDIESALDSIIAEQETIIAIQESLIGGDAS